jgi:hypothetical protein
LLRKRLNLAGLKAVFAKVTFDNAYAAGGLALDPTKLGLTNYLRSPTYRFRSGRDPGVGLRQQEADAVLA